MKQLEARKNTCRIVYLETATN